MAAWKVGRYLAPIALVATAVTLYVIVHGSLTTSHASGPPVTHSVVVPTAVTKKTKSASARVYVVRAGDTLSSISLKTGVSVAKLETLNPRVNPNALQTGQRLRLRG